MTTENLETPPTAPNGAVSGAEKAVGKSRVRRQMAASSTGPWLPPAARINALLLELGWIVAAMTAPSIGSLQNKELVAAGLFAAYGVWKWSRIRLIPPQVLWIALAMSLGAPAGWGSEFPDDFWTPVFMGLAAVTVMGIFVVEYHREEDLRLIALVAIVTLPIACYSSVTRNELYEHWSGGSRLGMNLIAYFLALGCIYAMTLRTPFVFLGFLLLLFLSGSRTSVATVAVTLLLYPRFRTVVWRNAIPILLIGACFFLGKLLYAEHIEKQITQRIALPDENFSMKERYAIDDMQFSISGRIKVAQAWFNYFLKNRSLFGAGITSYGWQDEDIDFPHNGILHVFNGLGFPAGLIYTVTLLWLLRRYLQRYANLTNQYSWAAAFFAAIFVRTFTEAQLLVSATHIGGFLLCYGNGLAIYGLVQAETTPQRRSLAPTRTRRNRPDAGSLTTASAG